VLSHKVVYVENVIPAERAAARESRNPGKYKEKPRFPLQPEADPSFGGFAGMTNVGATGVNELLGQHTSRDARMRPH
jgi:hypothetical protein